MLGAAVALLREQSDDTIRSLEEIEALTSPRPVLAVVPSQSRRGAQGGVISLIETRSPASEAFRTLRTGVQFARHDRDIDIVQVTSPDPGDGKSTTAANLAVTFAQAGQRTVLVDCDLRRPTVHTVFTVRNDRGLTNVLRDEADPFDVLYHLPSLPDLTLLTSGPLPDNPAELLSERTFRAALDQLRSRFDVVVLDSAPLLPVSDGAIVSKQAEGIIMVVAAESSRRRHVTRSLRQLEEIGAPVLGVVFNRASTRSDRSYYSYYVPAHQPG